MEKSDKAGSLKDAQETLELATLVEALRSKSSILESILDNMTDGVIVSDIDGNYILYNQAARRILGAAPEQTAARSCSGEFGCFLPDRQTPYPEDGLPLARSLRGESVDSEEIYFRSHDRPEGAWLNATARPLLDEGGNLFGGVVVFRDISQRKRSEEDLRIRDERFQIVARATNDAVWDWDLRTNQVWWNDGIRTLFGYEPSGIQSDLDWWSSNLHPEDSERVRSKLEELFQKSGRYWTEEYRYRRAGGSYADILDRGYVIHDDDGKPIRMIGAMMDISSRKCAEEALRESERRFRMIFEESPVGMQIIDQHSRFIDCNGALCRLLGYSKEELWKMTLADVLHPDDWPSEQDGAGEALEKECSGYKVERRYITKEGAARWVQVTGAPVRNERGRFLYGICMIEDISERKRLEEQLLKSRKMEAVARLAGGIAHDFNNLLTAIVGYAGLVEDSLAPEDQRREDTAGILKAARHAADLTGQLLAFARMQIIVPRTAEINRLVTDAEPMLRGILGDAIEVTLRLDPEAGAVRVDPGQFEQLLMNLALNAKEALPSGGEVAIETEEVYLGAEHISRFPDLIPGSYAALSFRDGGLGMSMETLSHIFEPFYSTKERSRGRGLGLAVCYGIAKQAGGQIGAESSPGEGTVITIYLPRLASEIASNEASSLPRSTSQASETILLVDDDPLVRKIAERTLRRQGYNVIEASSGAEALSLSQSPGKKIDLLISDVVMPAIGGKEIADRIRMHRPGIKILFISGYTEGAFVTKGTLEEEVEFLSKPFTPAKLILKVREVLDR